MQRAEDPAGHLTDVLSVRSDTGPVRRVHGLERRHRTWYVIAPLAACVFAQFMPFQETSRITCRHFTHRSCIIILRLQRSWAGQH